MAEASTSKLLDAREGLRQAITAGTGVRTIAYLSDNIPAPCAHVRRLEFDPRYVLGRASAEYEFSARVYVGRVHELASQKKLDELADPTDGIPSAVEDGDNWPAGTPVQSAWVTLCGEINETTVGEESFLFADFDITVVM